MTKLEQRAPDASDAIEYLKDTNTLLDLATCGQGWGWYLDSLLRTQIRGYYFSYIGRRKIQVLCYHNTRNKNLLVTVNLEKRGFCNRFCFWLHRQLSEYPQTFEEYVEGCVMANLPEEIRKEINGVKVHLNFFKRSRD